MIKGYITYNSVEYIFSLEGNKLYLILKDKVNCDEKLSANKRKQIKIDPKEICNKWIMGVGHITLSKYFFHCVGYDWHSDNLQVVYVDYYTEMVTENKVINFSELKADGFRLSSEIIGAYIKDTIDIKKEDGTELVVSFPESIVESSNEQNKSIRLFYDFNMNPHYHDIKCLKSFLEYKNEDSNIEQLFKDYESIKVLFSFLARKRSISISEFTIIKKNTTGFTEYTELCRIKSTSKIDDLLTNSISNKLFSKYAMRLFELIQNKVIDCYHLPSSDKFEPAQIIMLYAWFEKIYKTIPNSKFELKGKDGREKLYWKEKTKNGKDKPVSEKQQLDALIEDHKFLVEESFNILFTYGGFFESTRFIKEWTKRVVDFRNDIVHNRNIEHYDFIIQDRIFLEYVVYYLIFKYLCKCSDEELRKLLEDLFMKLHY